ncbi:MAG: Hpt domain-containing protein [Pseudomonadota bacterium]
MTQMPTDFFGTEMLEEFYDRARAVLTALEDYAARADDADLPALLRDLHSLKGNAGAFGVSDIERLCHRLEGELADKRAWTAALKTQVDVYLAHLNVLLEQDLGSLQSVR